MERGPLIGGRAAAVAVALLTLQGCAAKPAPPLPTELVQTGYLPEARVQALATAVPPPPAAGSERERADQARSLAYRPLEGGDRWLMATAHAELRPALAGQHFDCALGTRLNAAAAPALTRLLTRVQFDVAAAASVARTRYSRPRPAASDPNRRLCQRVTDAVRDSPSYPSASAAVAVAYAEVFAALDPASADRSRTTGHQIAVSRAICAMEWPEDVVTGEALGVAVHEAMTTIPAFRTDLEAARIDLAAAKATGSTNPGCAAERLAFSVPLL